LSLFTLSLLESADVQFGFLKAAFNFPVNFAANVATWLLGIGTTSGLFKQKKGRRSAPFFV